MHRDDGLAIRDLVAGIMHYHDEESTAERAIRHYVQSGLVEPPFKKGRYARYHTDTLKRLVAIEHFRREGMTVSEINELLKSVTSSSVIDFVSAGFDRDRLRPQREPRGTTGELVALLLSLSRARRQAGRSAMPVHESGDTWIRVPITENIEIGAKLEHRAMTVRKLQQLAGLLRQLILDRDEDLERSRVRGEDLLDDS